MSVEVAPASDAVVSLAGDLEASGLQVLREHVLRAVDEAVRARVVIDWTGLVFDEPASLGALIAVAEELTASGHRVVLVGPTAVAPGPVAGGRDDAPRVRGGPQGGSIGRGPTAAATPSLPEEVAAELVGRLFAVGRELTSAQSYLGPGDARRRLDAAVEDLAGLVRELRGAALASPFPPRPPAA